VKGFQIPRLPSGVTLMQVYADFLGYLFEHTREFFETRTPNGKDIWSRLQNDIVIVLTTPNGWDTRQQHFLQKAVVKAKLTREDDVDKRIEFITESEASVHFALPHTKTHTWLKPGTTFMVTDAGGSTVDSVLYECQAIDPKLVLREVCASDCVQVGILYFLRLWLIEVQTGGVFVDQAAQRLFTERFKKSRFGGSDFINDMVKGFEAKVVYL
jgi:hypothetical protein